VRIDPHMASCYEDLHSDGYARMAELADAPDSKSGSRKRVGVRPSLWAPSVRSVAAGLPGEVIAARCRFGLCANLNQIKHADPLVDMSEWVAYR
jgi:hypothetical protein